ncbi:MAG: hypothetical protein Q8P50_02440 [Bacillota bacterium]|nr:hypothetical protein [Bacillota bacterium]
MIVGGIDTLEYSIGVENYGEMLAKYIDGFEIYKLAAQEGPETVNIDGIWFEATPAGIRNYAFGFKCEDFWLFFARKTTTRNYPVWVKVSSGGLWSLGIAEIAARVEKLLASMGFRAITTKVSRVDLAVDTDELEFKPEDRESCVTRGASIDVHETYGEFTGFTVGRGEPIMLRVYDKTREVKKSGKDWMKWLWAANEWYGERVWRVEFQCRRELMREMRVETLAYSSESVHPFRSNPGSHSS